jgi:hypothetical protein
MTKIRRKKWDTDKLIKQPGVREEYENKLQMKLQDRGTEFSEDIDRKRNEMERGFQPRVTGCESKDGRTLGEEKEVLDRWTEHFEELLRVGKENEDPEIARRNAGPLVDNDDDDNADDDGQCELPTYKEVEYNIQKLKKNKAPGEDNITAELINMEGKQLWKQYIN